MAIGGSLKLSKPRGKKRWVRLRRSATTNSTPAAFAQEAFHADLAPLNNSGASGTANLALEGDQLTTDIASEGLAPGLPHAQYIHGLEQAMSECPTLANDQDGDGLVNTTEGEPSYGPILTSLTTEGDSSPESGLAVDRFPMANEDGTLTAELGFSRDSWVTPADIRRVSPEEDADLVAIEQVRGLLRRLAEQSFNPLFDFDAGYDPVRLQLELENRPARCSST